MNFSMTNIIGGLIFGSIGFIAFVYGKKQSNFITMIIGALLMAYPYFIQNNILLYVIGAALTGALFFFRD